jgi:hypothetical protein
MWSLSSVPAGITLKHAEARRFSQRFRDLAAAGIVNADKGHLRFAHISHLLIAVLSSLPES